MAVCRRRLAWFGSFLVAVCTCSVVLGGLRDKERRGDAVARLSTAVMRIRLQTAVVTVKPLVPGHGPAPRGSRHSGKHREDVLGGPSSCGPLAAAVTSSPEGELRTGDRPRRLVLGRRDGPTPCCPGVRRCVSGHGLPADRRAPRAQVGARRGPRCRRCVLRAREAQKRRVESPSREVNRGYSARRSESLA